MDPVGKKRKPWRRIERVISATLLILLGLALLLFFLIQTPPVQNLARKKVVAYLEKKLETKVEIGRLNVGFDRLALRDLYLEDRNADTLLAGGDAVVRLNVLKLLFNNELDVASIRLQDFTANVNRSIVDTAYNFQFIIDAFTRPEGRVKDTGTITYTIPEIEFTNIRFSYNDVVSGLTTSGHLKALDAEIDTLDGTNFYFDLPELTINGLDARVYQYKPLEISTGPDTSASIIPRFNFGELELKDIQLDFQNHVSSLFTNVNIDQLSLQGRSFDIASRTVELDLFALSNSSAFIRLGQSQEAKKVEEQVEQEIEKAARQGWTIRIKELDLRNNHLKFDNDNKGTQRLGMDFAHLESKDFNLQVEDLSVGPDSIGGKILSGSFREKGGFHLQDLRANALYSNNAIFLEDLYLKTPGTELKRYARLDFASPEQLGRNFPATRMDVDISRSYVKVSDILAFAPSLARHRAFSNPSDTWYLNLLGSGTLNSFRIEEFQFDGLADTRLNVDGTLAIGNANQTGGSLNIHQFHSTQTDIALFTGSKLNNANLRLPESFDITGTLRGGSQGLNVDLQIASTAGNLAIDGSLNNLGNAANASYAANVQTRDLNLGSILMDTKLGRLSADFTINGKGLSAGNFDSDFKGRVHSLGYNGYAYSNIALDGSLHGSALRAVADVNDPNIDLNGELVADLGGGSFRFDGFVDSVKLQPLGLSKERVVMRGKIEANIPVVTKETLEADVMITDALLVSASQRLALDTVRFVADRNDSMQVMDLYSDVARVNLQGQFRFGELGNMFQHAIQPYFAVNPGRTPSVTEPYALSFYADISNVPVLADLVPGLQSFDPIHIEGTLNNVAGLNAVARTEHLDYNGNLLQGLDLTVATSSNGLQFTGDVKRLKSGTFDIHHTRLSGIANNNELDFALAMDDALGRRRYNLGGILRQPSRGTYVLNLRQDSLLLNYQTWSVSANNSLTFTGDDLRANNFTLSQGQQVISLQSAGELLNVNFSNFQLSTITAFLKSDSLLANGSMTGTASFRNILRQPVFTSDLNIADLSIRGDTLGNAAIKVNNTSGNRYNTNATITGRGNDVSLTGSFAPSGQSDISLDLDLAIRQLQLSTVDGALGGFIKNSSGTVNGSVSINGSLSNPSISGPLRFNNASFALEVLGSQFRIDGEELMVTDNGFQFNDFVIRDTANQTMRLNGEITTTNFSNYAFDLDVKADNFQVLNTTKKDNKIYYGKLVVTTDLDIGGNTDRPEVDGAIVVNDGTDLTIVIPQREPGIVSREGVVEFVDLENPEVDTLFRAYDSLNIAPFRGMDIAANIEIRKEAVFNIVVDEANGDFLNVQGEALITTGIDPSGKITMVGNYELERGAYEITFNFLRRRFDIQKGSSIQWFNEPTGAILDIQAIYVANTSPIDLVQQQIEAATPAIRNTYLQRLPFEVHLDLTGQLLQPDVAFDIVLPPNRTYGVSNDIITQVDSRLAQLRADPGETNKQVFALLLLNRFVGENPFESSQEMFSGSRYVRESVSKLLTEQLNQLAAGLIEGVDLQFDVVTAEDYTTGERRSRTDLNIGLSTQLLSERLTVSVGTNFELEGDRPVTAGANNNNGTAIGNLSVEYALTRDKRFLIRFYRKNEYQGVIDGYVVESGLGFMISVDYEKFRELITRRKKQKVEGVE
jgi:hypothetical protein